MRQQQLLTRQIQQTPDLSSLDPNHLPEETLQGLPHITRLKNALYSDEFRQFVQDVTGCGPLSAKKNDGSVALYTKGSHLLLHDDSISTRVISYILYLPNSPNDAPPSEFSKPSDCGKFQKGWDPTWGGSLELFPVENGEERGLPSAKAIARVPASWGQIVFFQVKPGRSYHSVEEVIVGDGRMRLGVSGWFHRPEKGEPGYGVFDEEKELQALSSLAQITSAPSFPLVPYTTEPPLGLKPVHINFLKKFLKDSYLSREMLEKLAGQFVASSEAVLHHFLNPELAAKIKKECEDADKRDYPDRLIPKQECGEGDGWVLQGPSSKHRYASLKGNSEHMPALQSVLRDLIPSEAFRAWLSVVSSLMPMAYRSEARRFRRGLDYTLAAGEASAGEVRLDASLALTPWADVPPGSDEEEALLETGGWECYLPAPDADEDPAVYQSSLAKKAKEATSNLEADMEAAEAANKKPAEKPAEAAAEEKPAEEKPAEAAAAAPAAEEKPAEAKTNGANGADKPNGTNGDAKMADGDDDKPKPSISMGGVELEFDPDQFSDSDFDSVGDDDEGPLLTMGPGFNRLSLVLRDPGVMRFVKYLSANAPGSRWDIDAEWEVGMMEEDEEEIVVVEGQGDECPV